MSVTQADFEFILERMGKIHEKNSKGTEFDRGYKAAIDTAKTALAEMIPKRSNVFPLKPSLDSILPERCRFKSDRRQCVYIHLHKGSCCFTFPDLIWKGKKND